MTERERLIEELKSKFWIMDACGDTLDVYSAEAVADFIIEDRERILKPLMIMRDKEFPKYTMNGQLNTLWGASEETLKNTGL